VPSKRSNLVHRPTAPARGEGLPPLAHGMTCEERRQGVRRPLRVLDRKEMARAGDLRAFAVRQPLREQGVALDEPSIRVQPGSQIAAFGPPT